MGCYWQMVTSQWGGAGGRKGCISERKSCRIDPKVLKRAQRRKTEVMQSYLRIWGTYGSIALCGYPIVKIRDSSKIPTTAPILLLSNYFRQNFLQIASCTVSLLKNIWVRVKHSPVQQLNLQTLPEAQQTQKLTP